MKTPSAVIYSSFPLLTRPDAQAMLHERGLALHFFGAAEGEQAPTPDEERRRLMQHAPDMEFFIAGMLPLDTAFFQAATKLRLATMFGAGLNHIDIAAATRAGTLISNAPGANARSVAELTLALMLALARRIPSLHQDLMQGLWVQRMGSELLGKTLGVAGFGHVGQQVAVLGKALGMNVLFYNRSPKPQLAQKFECRQADFPTLLRESDYLSLNLPALPGDKPLVGAAELAAMKPTAFLINTGRGSLVDMDALGEALAARRLGGAGLDVFPTEPLTMSAMQAMRHPLYALPNVVAVPHVGAATSESVCRVTQMCLDDVLRVLRGERSPNVANPQVYDAPGRNAMPPAQ